MKIGKKTRNKTIRLSTKCSGVEKHRVVDFCSIDCSINFFLKIHISTATNLSGSRGELGDGLGTLRHGVLGKLTRKEETDGSLDLAGRQGGLLVVARQAGGLQSDALEDVVDERVQDGHSALGDTGVGVNLLQHLVDVRRVRLGSLGVLLGTSSLLGGLDSLLANRGVLSGWGHF